MSPSTTTHTPHPHRPLLLSPTTTTSSLHLPLHIRSILNILPEITDTAAHLVIRFETERDQGDEAESKPFPFKKKIKSAFVD